MNFERELKKRNSQFSKITFNTPVHTTYNPLRYAIKAHLQYLENYLKKPSILLLGMNPGPWGMAQNGIPFGEINAVKNWLKIDTPIQKPLTEHPKRPISGLDCTRSEVSGRRLWGWAMERYQKPENFFSKFFVLNYCPLVFMEESGKNLTPDKLKKNKKEELFKICDDLLIEFITHIQPEWVIGVGKFALERAQNILNQTSLTFKTGSIMHPSPANPHANRGWGPIIEKQFQEMGITL